MTNGWKEEKKTLQHFHNELNFENRMTNSGDDDRFMPANL